MMGKALLASGSFDALRRVVMTTHAGFRAARSLDVDPVDLY